MIENAYTQNIEKLAKTLKTSEQGLTPEESQKRLKQFGLNKIPKKKSFSLLKIVFDQFNSILIWILVFASAFSYYIGEHIDAYAIGFIIVINSLLGFIQEFKAEKSLEELKKMEKKKALVVRNNEKFEIDAAQLVPGDVIIVNEGKRISADARLIESHNLQVDESILTGESVPVKKDTKTLKHDLAIGDQYNMIFSGCTVTRGRGKAIVVHTGLDTEIGKIADTINTTINELTPLQKSINELSKKLAMISILFAAIGFVLGLFMYDKSMDELIITTISLAVSAIPEGLPVVVTIALALGIKRMVKVNVLVRKLSTAESLGSTEIICTDKTGTITHNQMTVQNIYLPKIGQVPVTGKGYQIKGEVQSHDLKQNEQDRVKRLIINGVLCSDATLDFGDPTERSLIVLAHKHDFSHNKLRQTKERIEEIPFNSNAKFMSVITQEDNNKYVIVKGATEVILEMCDLYQSEKEEILAQNKDYAQNGLRVLAFAQKQVNFEIKDDYQNHLKSLKFTGLVAMSDPARKEVEAAIQRCYQSGIRVVMITGDHKDTAEAIAREVNLKFTNSITGTEIDKLTEIELREVVKKTNVFARVNANHKYAILETLQKQGYQVAMTGDGVNDGPAVKKADVGIAVGSGTDLTKQVSDMILLDNNFSSISKAIYEGRKIFFNIKKFLKYLVSSNFDEIIEMIVSIILHAPLPYLPIHILWINIATDSLPALSLTMDKVNHNVMDKRPYNPKEEIIKGVVPYAFVVGFLTFFFTYPLFLISQYVWGYSETHARTINFTAAIIFELLFIYAVRSNKNMWKYNIFKNMFLNLSVLLGILSQMFIIYHPFGNKIFHTQPLSLKDWAFVILASGSAILTLEILKALKDKIQFIKKNIIVD